MTIGVLCRNDTDRTSVRRSLNRHLLPIGLKSEPETVHVHAHGLPSVYFASLRVIITEQIGENDV